MKILWEVARRFGAPAIVAVLSGDLLILYYQGNWADPNQFIETFEVAGLYIVTIYAIGAAIAAFTKLIREAKSNGMR